MGSIDSAVNSAMNTGMIITVVSVVGGLLITVFVLFFVFRTFRGISQQAGINQAILATGIPAQAKILQLLDTGTTVNDNPMAQLVLEVYGQNGATYQTQVRMLVPRLKLGQLQPGMMVNVRVDPADASKVAVALA